MVSYYDAWLLHQHADLQQVWTLFNGYRQLRGTLTLAEFNRWLFDHSSHELSAGANLCDLETELLLTDHELPSELQEQVELAYLDVLDHCQSNVLCLLDSPGQTALYNLCSLVATRLPQASCETD